MMAKAKEGDTVKVNYNGSLNDGTVFDSSYQREEPLEFTIGSRDVIPGFEDQVKGMEVGESKTFTVPSQEAYGQRSDELVIDIERERVPEDIDPQEGMVLQVKGEDGSVSNVQVVGVTDEKVTLDANHPLAGQDLNFEIKLEDIQE
jgi:peptidylprolyl isomerase